MSKIKMPKIAFVTGHYRNNKGAYSEVMGISEWSFFMHICANHLSDLGDIYSHNGAIPSYTSRQAETAELTEQYDLSIELHFDMFNGSAHGCHAMHYHENKETKRLSGVLCDSIESLMNIKNRGLVPVYDSSRNGAGFIMQQKTNAILLECFFGDAESDVRKFSGEKFRAVIINLIDAMTGLDDGKR